MRHSRVRFGDIFLLREQEHWWRDRYLFFESRGYRLRSRFHPDWVPSWETARRRTRPGVREDHVRQPRITLIDATRIKDDKMVYLKKVWRGGAEKSIALFLSSENLWKDPQNHCVPIYEYFDDPHDEMLGFIVMPLLRHFNDPQMKYVSDVVEFVHQTLVGLSFMHYHNVAHRDCAHLNIMLDASDMYPEGFHPIHQDLDRMWNSHARYHERHEVQNVKYYFIDFGLSSHFAEPNRPRLVLGEDCQERDVPELSRVCPYDPFPVDIFILGNLYVKYFTKGLPTLYFLRPLAEAMTSESPADRPTIGEALEKFEKIIEELSEEDVQKEILPLPVPQPSMQARLVKNMSSKTKTAARRIRVILGNLTASTFRYRF